MSLRYRIKRNARIVLKGNWLKAIIILFIIGFLVIAIGALESAYSLAFGISDKISFDINNPDVFRNSILLYLRTTLLVSLIFSVISFIFTTPLKQGQTEWYWNLDKKPLGVEGVFAWFGSPKLFGKSLWLYLNIALRLLPWGLLLIGLPYAVIFSSLSFFDTKDQNLMGILALLICFGYLLLLGGVVLFVYIGTNYFLAPYLLVEDSTRKVNACVKSSKRYVKGVRGDIFTFWFSFIGWFLLCCFLFPIFYVFPYFSASSAIYAKYLIYSARIKERDGTDKTIEFESKQLNE